MDMIKYILKSCGTLLVALAGLGSLSSIAQTRDRLDVPIEAPQFCLPDLDGNQIDIKDYRGDFVVIHIATTWCPFCNAEAPHLEELRQAYADQNVRVLIMDVKESRELVKEKLQDRFKFTFPVLLDMDGAVAASFAPADVLPDLARDEIMLASNLLIDPEGNIRFQSLLDSKNFDAKLLGLKKVLDELLSAQ
jgi:peroxiredoxin